MTASILFILMLGVGLYCFITLIRDGWEFINRRRFSFHELHQLFTADSIRVGDRSIGNTMMGQFFPLIKYTEIKSSADSASATYLRSVGDIEDEVEAVIIKARLRKFLSIHLEGGHVITVDHAGVHTRSDFKYDELEIINALCARIKTLAQKNDHTNIN